jgi:anti-sigma regulatory factor (Ser/Thr protein kinase)
LNEEVQLELPRTIGCAAQARRATTAWLGDEVGIVERHNALLVVSELVTNAYEHGSGKIALKLRLVDDELQVEVTDEGRGAAVEIRERDIDEGGMGLRIVDQLANRWGVYEGTTHVWAKLPIA